MKNDLRVAFLIHINAIQCEFVFTKILSFFLISFIIKKEADLLFHYLNVESSPLLTENTEATKILNDKGVKMITIITEYTAPIDRGFVRFL